MIFTRGYSQSSEKFPVPCSPSLCMIPVTHATRTKLPSQISQINFLENARVEDNVKMIICLMGPLNNPRVIIEADKPESSQVAHSWVRILALIPCLVVAANLLSVQLKLSIQLSISLSIQL